MHVLRVHVCHMERFERSISEAYNMCAIYLCKKHLMKLFKLSPNTKLEDIDNFEAH